MKLADVIQAVLQLGVMLSFISAHSREGATTNKGTSRFNKRTKLK